MAKNKKNSDITGPDEALERARSASNQLKPKDEALYWATMAQALLLDEMCTIMREERTNNGSVELPEQAPARETARVTVTEH